MTFRSGWVDAPIAGDWGTVEEISIAAPPPVGASKLSVGEAPVRLKDVEGSEVARRETGIGELDRVLGGGLVSGSLIRWR